jgi:hypothetical protein
VAGERPLIHSWAKGDTILTIEVLNDTPVFRKLEDVDGSIRAVVKTEIGRIREFRSELIQGVYPIC